jgi:hypothetical protein
MRRAAVLVAAGGACAAGVSLAANPESGPSRSLRFWTGALPVYAHYKWVEYVTQPKTLAITGGAAAESGLINREEKRRKLANEAERERSRRYGELHKKYAPEMEKLTLNLKGLRL